MTDHPLPTILLAFVDEVDQAIERWEVDRAYMVAGGPFLLTASRLGWPQADRALSYVLAVRRLANINRPPMDVGLPDRRDRGRAEQHYRQERDDVRAWLTSPSVSQS